METTGGAVNESKSSGEIDLINEYIKDNGIEDLSDIEDLPPFTTQEWESELNMTITPIGVSYEDAQKLIEDMTDAPEDEQIRLDFVNSQETKEAPVDNDLFDEGSDIYAGIIESSNKDVVAVEPEAEAEDHEIQIVEKMCGDREVQNVVEPGQNQLELTPKKDPPIEKEDTPETNDISIDEEVPSTSDNLSQPVANKKNKKGKAPRARAPRASASNGKAGGVYVVEKILGMGYVGEKVNYFIKWKNFGEEFNTWEPLENLNCPKILKAFEKKWKGNSEVQSTPTSHCSKETPSTSAKKSPVGRRKGKAQPKAPATKGEKFKAKDVKTEEDQGPETPKLIGKSKKPKKEIERIIGFSRVDNELIALIKWKGIDKISVMPRLEARALFPQAFITFYEERLHFEAEEE